MAGSEAARVPVDVLRDPHRVNAARRLLTEVSGPAAYDRLSSLAARMLGTGHAKVTLFTAEDTVIGGHGLPPGVVGGPALLTGAISALTVRQGAPLVVPDAAHDQRVARLPAVTSGQVAAYLGAPLVAASGHVVGVLAVYDTRPREWSDDEAALLEQLGASVIAELELAAARSAIGASLARLDVALEASSVGIWERDLRTGTLLWDERSAALFGVDGATQLDSLDRALEDFVHPDDHAAVQEAMRTAIERRAEFMAEARVLRRDGTELWTVSRGRVVTDSRGEPVRMLGTILDVTGAREEARQRLFAVHRAAAMAEVAAQLANATRLQDLAGIAQRGVQVLGARSSALAVFDHDGGPLRLHMTRDLIDTVEAGEDIQLPEDGVELPMDDSLPMQYVARHGERLLLSRPEEGEDRFPRMTAINALLGIRALAALPLRVEGRVLGGFVAVWQKDHDFAEDDLEVLEALTAQIALSASKLQADAERARAVAAMSEATARLELLAEVGRVLSGSLDITQQIGQLADLVVPTLGDWCWIVVTDEQGRLHALASAHRDPARNAELEAYVRSMVSAMTDAAAARVVTRTGRPLVLPHIDRATVERALPDPATQAALQRLGLESGAIVPLTARGATLGALGVFTDPERGPHTQAEIDTTVEVGRRAGLALHNARLFGQQRALADALQHSMLTAPPEPDHCEIVVRYVPAAAGVEIGGDWYDAFLEAGGATVLVIGDVVGHDSRAAAAMGQVRGLLRGISFSSGAPPSEVLTQLDRALRGLALGTMATALVARLEQDEADLRRNQTRLRWSSAGHLAPVVVQPDGRVTVAEPHTADLLLGVDPATPRSDRVTVLPAGSTVFLYTDGLVERRDRDLDAGTAELAAVLREYVGLPLEEICDRVLERMFLPDAEDDVALLAVRLHPQDEPRPIEAGPQIVPPGIAPAPAVHPQAGTEG
ncbi:MAG TPA: SpoIIE family protein phosphatase [Geodermatophilus sp.]|nr:SpoIIE family protein phosphatase [Geodermatophilus sp.]